MLNEPDPYQDLRDAVRQLCRQFPDEYFREEDERRAYPEKFVDALMAAGWLGAMIPEDYGGPGLGLPDHHLLDAALQRGRELVQCGGPAQERRQALGVPTHCQRPLL